MSDITQIASEQTSQTAQAGNVWRNPALPERRYDFRSMGWEEYRRYKDQIKRILCGAGESDETRRLAFEMLLDADRILWPNSLANQKYWKAE